MVKILDEKTLKAWEKAQIAIEGQDEWRKDACGAWIDKDQYGEETPFGWGIDHIFPITQGGTDHIDNRRAFHWKNNRSKGSDFPTYTSAVTSDGQTNVDKENRKTVHEDTIEKLKLIYPQIKTK